MVDGGKKVNNMAIEQAAKITTQYHTHTNKIQAFLLLGTTEKYVADS